MPHLIEHFIGLIGEARRGPNAEDPCDPHDVRTAAHEVQPGNSELRAQSRFGLGCRAHRRTVADAPVQHFTPYRNSIHAEGTQFSVSVQLQLVHSGGAAGHGQKVSGGA